MKKEIRLLFVFLVLLRLFFTCDYPSKDKFSCSWGEDFLTGIIHKQVIFSKINNYSKELIFSYFPSPQAELILGMTIGMDLFDKLPTFNDVLLISGTIHVVVVSGFNINLLYTFMQKIFGERFRYKPTLFVFSMIFTFMYSVISGFEPPVIRAWIMGTLISVKGYTGFEVSSGKILELSAAIILLFDPSLIASMSFLLSYTATIGLMLFPEVVSKLVSYILPDSIFLKEDLVSTTSAQLLVWPIISYSFGRVSIISLLSNTFSLWTVPLITILGLLMLIVGIFRPLGMFLYYVTTPLLHFFIFINKLFSNLPYASIDLKVSTLFLCIYYFGLLLLWKKFRQYFS